MPPPPPPWCPCSSSTSLTSQCWHSPGLVLTSLLSSLCTHCLGTMAWKTIHALMAPKWIFTVPIFALKTYLFNVICDVSSWMSNRDLTLNIHISEFFCCTPNLQTFFSSSIPHLSKWHHYLPSVVQVKNLGRSILTSLSPHTTCYHILLDRSCSILSFYCKNSPPHLRVLTGALCIKSLTNHC